MYTWMSFCLYQLDCHDFRKIAARRLVSLSRPILDTEKVNNLKSCKHSKTRRQTCSDSASGESPDSGTLETRQNAHPRSLSAEIDNAVPVCFCSRGNSRFLGPSEYVSSNLNTTDSNWFGSGGEAQLLETNDSKNARLKSSWFKDKKSNRRDSTRFWFRRIAHSSRKLVALRLVIFAQTKPLYQRGRHSGSVLGKSLRLQATRCGHQKCFLLQQYGRREDRMRGTRKGLHPQSFTDLICTGIGRN
jgi:hypothetical protein